MTIAKTYLISSDMMYRSPGIQKVVWCGAVFHQRVTS